MPKPITTDEWLKAFGEAAGKAAEGSLTTKEIGKLLKLSDHQTDRLIDRAIESGQIEYAGPKPMRARNQVMQPRAAYRLVQKVKKAR